VRQLAIVSGKGGTGKTSIAAVFAELSKRSVLADCDVDAPNLHIFLHPVVISRETFKGLKVATKDEDKCVKCGLCAQNCRFDAINKDFEIDPLACEGCGVCSYVCPEKAVTMVDRDSGEVFISKTRFGLMAHARLDPGEETTGKLVTVVRNNAKKIAEENDADLVIIDGPPGIGCPVIATIGGTDLVLAVTEPTLTGLHDLTRVLGVADHFGVPSVVCINKADINPTMTERISKYCEENGKPVVGVIPYDKTVVKALVEGKSLLSYPKSPALREIRGMWIRVLDVLGLNRGSPIA